MFMVYCSVPANCCNQFLFPAFILVKKLWLLLLQEQYTYYIICPSSKIKPRRWNKPCRGIFIFINVLIAFFKVAVVAPVVGSATTVIPAATSVIPVTGAATVVSAAAAIVVTLSKIFAVTTSI